MPAVTVVTPLYNSSQTIASTLDSLLAQSAEDWECILVDDGSTDDTRAIVAPYLDDPRFRLISHANRGIAGARNTAIRAARGTWVCLLDHDDRWVPEKLETQLREAARGGWNFLCSDAVVLEGERKFLYSDWFFSPAIVAGLERSQKEGGVDFLGLLLQANFVSASSVMVERRFFDQFGLLAEGAAPADDYDMWLRIIPHVRLRYLPSPLVEYVVHDRNFSRDRVKLHTATARVLDKHRRLLPVGDDRRPQFEAATAMYYRQAIDHALRERNVRGAVSIARRRRGARMLGLAVATFVRSRLGIRRRFRDALGGRIER